MTNKKGADGFSGQSSGEKKYKGKERVYNSSYSCVFFTRCVYVLCETCTSLCTLTRARREDTVAKECEDNEEDGEDHPFVVYSSLGLNAIVHHHVPVLSCQDLQKYMQPKRIYYSSIF